MLDDFEGQAVVITGAAHGFGRRMAAAFAQQGAAVFACDLLGDELAETQRIAGDRCTTAQFDICDSQRLREFVALAESQSKSGAVDVLVNNAGGVLGQTGQAIEDVSPADWQSIFDVNLSAVFYCAQAVAPGMKKNASGRIVNISSGAGLGVSLTGIQSYASAKAGQIGLTRQLAHELGPFGITVNCVAPGFVRANATTEKQWQAMGADGQQALLNSLSLRRLGTANDIANAVMFFASSNAAWVTGQVLAVDGGRR